MTGTLAGLRRPAENKNSGMSFAAVVFDFFATLTPSTPEAVWQEHGAGLVDARVLSCEAGRRKPDPVLFTTIARQLGVAPADCLYVGDGGGGELSGASACGMHAVMLRAADWYTSAAHARKDDWAGPWVPSLSAVLPLLDGLRPAHGAPAAGGGTA
jgi:phosphoglycolate phosphatase-like HAD superfamily hydrolase